MVIRDSDPIKEKKLIIISLDRQSGMVNFREASLIDPGTHPEQRVASGIQVKKNELNQINSNGNLAQLNTWKSGKSRLVSLNLTNDSCFLELIISQYFWNTLENMEELLMRLRMYKEEQNGRMWALCCQQSSRLLSTWRYIAVFAKQKKSPKVTSTLRQL